MKLLLTGFEPFDGRSLNPSQLAVQQLVSEGLPGCEIVPVILPVIADRAPGLLLTRLEEVQPEVLLSLGLAGSRPVISIERIAINLLDFRIPDNAGRQLLDNPIVADGPAAYFATLPVRAMYEAVLAAGVPVELSLSAGAYLCNQVMYAALHLIAVRGWRTRAGFVHLPALPEMVTTRPMPSMSLETMLTGLRAMLAVIT
jgi:pyroglutamyl-peptidase